MKLIDNNSVDTIITSPPYNKLGLRKGKKIKTTNSLWGNCRGEILYDTYDDNLDEESYYDWQIDFLNECCRVLKPNGSVFYNHKIRRYNNIGYFPKWVFESNLKFYQMIIWNRKSFVNCRNEILNPQTELIFWLVKDKPKVYKQNAIHKGEIWDISPKPNKNHPAPFPEEIAENCILLSSKEGDIILDPFIGSGTTAKVAILNNRKYIGFDISKEYCGISEKAILEVNKS